MSETAAAKAILAPFCKGPITLDMGFGGDLIVPHALGFDMPQPYTKVAGERQTFKGDCRDLSFLCDESVDQIFSSHLLEDFTFKQLPKILIEWRRVLKTGGLLITNCPDQQIYSKHCSDTGQPYNESHKEPTFGLKTFKELALKPSGPWMVEFEQPVAEPYSFYIVVSKQ
jgi:ubiquinone/menaquinone biosynthesis C-methylase UbiE